MVGWRQTMVWRRRGGVLGGGLLELEAMGFLTQ